MFARKGLFSSIGRTAVMATVAAVALTEVEPSLALAGSAPSGKGVSAATATSGATDFGARRRYYRGGGGSAAAGAFAAIVRTGMIAASRNRRDDYYYGGDPAYYGGGPTYYGGGPVYYGGDPYYGRRPWQVECASFQWSPARRLVTVGFRTDRSAGCPCAAGGFPLAAGAR
jgi:hypothetical protein